MNRFTNITQATYTPLSLQEIMAVPLAKQAQHDALQAEMDAEGIYTANVSQSDKERIGSQVDALNKGVSDISTSLGEEGISSDLKSKFRKLKADKARAYSADGDIGFAQADYANQAKYMSDMKTNKDMQAGWSGQEAQAFAAKQVAEYGSSFNEDGTRKAGFSGRSLATKVNETEWLRDHIGDIEHKISNSSLRVIERQGLPAFQMLVQKGQAEYKDLNTIMGYLANAAQTDTELMASLRQQAEFNGEENWSDFGNYEEKIVKDADGRNVKQTIFVPGNSRFGRKMAGIGQVSAYYRENIDESLLEDSIGLKVYEMGMEEERAVSLVNIMDGEGIQPDNLPVISEIEDDLKIYDDEASLMEDDLIRYTRELKFGNSKAPIRSDEEVDKLLAGDRAYQKMKKDYQAAKAKSSRTKSLLDAANKRVEANYLNENDKLAKGLLEQMSTPKDIFALYKKIFGKEYEGNSKAIIGRDVSKVSGRKTTYGKTEEEQNKIDLDNAAMAILEEKGVVGTSVSGLSNSNTMSTGFEDFKKRLTSRIDDGHRKLLEVEKYALHYKNLSSESEGKNATEIGRINKLKTSDLNKKGLVGQMLAYGGGKGKDLDLEKLVGEFGTETNDKPLEYTYTMSGTGSWDHEGNKFSEVAIYNPNTQKYTTVQVIDNDTDNMRRAALQLKANGTSAQTEEARNILAGLDYMPSIKRSNMTYSNEGIIDGLQLTTKSGKPINIKWVKHQKEGVATYFTASAGGETLKIGKYDQIMGENEMALAIYDYMEKKQNDYMKKKQEADAKAQQKK